MSEESNTVDATIVRKARVRARDVQQPEDGHQGRRARSVADLGGASRVTGLILLALLLAVFAVWIPGSFFTSQTAKTVLSQQAVTLIVAIGLLFPLAAGQFDLSIAQNLGLTSLLAATLTVYDHMAPGLAAVITVFVGTGIGAINGFLVAFVGVSSFIATLGMTSVLLAINEQISNNQFVGPVPASFTAWTDHAIAGVPIIAVYAVVVAVVGWYLLEHTPWGRRIYATGAGSEAARLAGVRTPRFVFFSLMISGGVASLAGVLLASQLGDLSPTLGPPYLLPAFAACFLGSTQLKIGRFNIWGTVLAIVLLATGEQGLQLADGGQLWVTDMFNGVALIGAVSIAVIASRRKRAAA